MLNPWGLTKIIPKKKKFYWDPRWILISASIRSPSQNLWLSRWSGTCAEFWGQFSLFATKSCWRSETSTDPSMSWDSKILAIPLSINWPAYSKRKMGLVSHLFLKPFISAKNKNPENSFIVNWILWLLLFSLSRGWLEFLWPYVQGGKKKIPKNQNKTKKKKKFLKYPEGPIPENLYSASPLGTGTTWADWTAGLGLFPNLFLLFFLRYIMACISAALPIPGGIFGPVR